MSSSSSSSAAAAGGGSSSRDHHQHRRPTSSSSSRARQERAVPSVRAGALPASETIDRMRDLALPHIESFNYMLGDGLRASVADIPPREFKTSSGDSMHLWIEEANVGFPTKTGDGAVADPRLLPSECRERGMTYAAPLNVTLCRKVNDGEVQRISAKLGEVPIMVRSSHCHLANLGPYEMVRAGEEAVEFGGYFICNGIERIIRMLQIPKRNYPMAIERSAYTNRGPLYSNKGVVIRCARPDQSSVTLTLHYLNDGSATVRFTVRKQEFFLPVIMVLKALVDTTDREIYERVLAGDRTNTYLSDRVLMLLRDAKRYEGALASREAALTYLGARFRFVLDVPETLTDVEVGQTLLDRFVLVHIPKEASRDKYNLLVLMLRKLYAFVAGSILDDNADSLANQELLLSGHLLQLFIKEKLHEFIEGIETSIKKEDSLYSRAATAKAKAAEEEASAAAAASAAAGSSKKGKQSRKGRKDAEENEEGDASTSSAAAPTAVVPRAYSNAVPVNLNDGIWFRKIMERQPEVGKKVYYLLATGNMVSSSGLDMMQVSGYTVVADKINFLRFTTHFRSVHRGQFFTEMKTTTVRKLLPENWGFLCPVHTPDGGPCGLLNHLAQPASVVAHPLSAENFASASSKASQVAEEAGTSSGRTPTTLSGSLTAFLVALGMTAHSATGAVLPADHMPILLDGRVLGGAPPHTAYRISRALRHAKAATSNIRALVDGLGGGLKNKPQTVAVEALRRAAVLGLTDVSDSLRTARRAAHVGAIGDGDEDEEDEGRMRGLGIGGMGVVPPSMEVAFLPPPWWDAEIDPRITDPAEEQARFARLSFIGAASASSKSGSATMMSFEEEEKKSEGGGFPSTSSAAGGAAGSSGVDEKEEAPTKVVGLFAGLFLNTAPQRLVRPVIQLDTGLIELVSPLEQPYMDIACTPEDVEEILHVNMKEAEASEAAASATTGAAKGAAYEKDKKSSKKGQNGPPTHLLYTHIELSAVAMLSELACLTPFSDMNQSPRNMYQCQMAKQTMGTPLHSWNHRPDTKLFRLTTPQAPLVQNGHQRLYGFDEYPNGANACVAVIAYTGFDMEDACIINKSAFERGFGWASVYKTYEVDLLKDRPSTDAGRFVFHNQYVKGEQPVRGANAPPPGSLAAAAAASSAAGQAMRASELPRVRPGDKVFEAIDEDGLPPVGAMMREGDPLYAFLDIVTGTHKVVRHKDLEPAYVDEIRILPPRGASSSANAGIQRVSIKMRYDRRPVVGDKFSSRHGQKGVLSFLWPQENMPFNDQGMTPDVIINPHAFPSRMTVGMLVESMAGKAGSLHGVFQDSTPFTFNEGQRAVDHFGEQLAASGYNYYGTETFYSGVTGEPIPCDIYYGVVYYQRLRHMVKDKAQVRSTGPINALTRQPVKGRKKGGGIRFGEMERDALLAHGTAFLLHDRLMNSSDRHIALVCKKCGSLLSPYSVPATVTKLRSIFDVKRKGEDDGDGDGDTNAFTSDVTHANIGGAADAVGGVVNRRRRQPMCRACGTGEHVVPIPVPYVFRYLANELAGMNIKIQLEVGEGPHGPAIPIRD